MTEILKDKPMVNIKTSDLVGKSLDWAVAQLDPSCEGLTWEYSDTEQAWFGIGSLDNESKPSICAVLSSGHSFPDKMRFRRLYSAEPYHVSTNWQQCGLLIDRHEIEIHVCTDRICRYWARAYGKDSGAFGDTPRIAACRAIVVARFGKMINIPAQLAKEDRL